MDCGQNIQHYNRNGRNINGGGINSGRNTCCNTMPNRNTRNDMMSGRNNQGNMAQNRSNCCNMNRMYPEKRCAGCDRGTEHVDHMMPGMTFVPWQKWEDIYPVEEGLENGTIFKQLNKPFIGRK